MVHLSEWPFTCPVTADGLVNAIPKHFYVVVGVKLLVSLTSLVTSPAGGSVSDSGIDPE